MSVDEINKLWAKLNRLSRCPSVARGGDLDASTRRRLQALREVANDEFRNDEIAIDPLEGMHELSPSEEGVWVRAWVFLSNEILDAHGVDGA